jgi:hypothetical protein
MGEVSWHGLTHFALAGLGFFCLVGACMVMGSRFARTNEAGWAWYSRITGIVFALSFIALSSGAAAAVVVFTAAVVAAWAWLAAVSVKLYRSVE